VLNGTMLLFAGGDSCCITSEATGWFHPRWFGSNISKISRCHTVYDCCGYSRTMVIEELAEHLQAAHNYPFSDSGVFVSGKIITYRTTCPADWRQAEQ